jgi:hypothetical protein
VPERFFDLPLRSTQQANKKVCDMDIRSGRISSGLGCAGECRK